MPIARYYGRIGRLGCVGSVAWPPVRRVVMYSRRRCGLCDEARQILLAQRQRTPFQFEEVDIEGSDELERAHGLRVPVVEVDGREAFETFVNPDALARLLEA